MRQIKRFVPSILILVLLVGIQSAVAQKNAVSIDYTVSISDVAKQEFHITTDIKNIDQPQLDLALPTWAPGWYTVENYFKNVLKFRITDAGGKQLFLEPIGHRNTPSSLKFQLPTGWKLMSALKDTADPMVFTAADYDTLVDAPTMMGKFDVKQFEVEGKPHYSAAAPAGTFNAEKLKKFTEI